MIEQYANALGACYILIVTDYHCGSNKAHVLVQRNILTYP